jgi:hypothetical protein
MKTKTKPTTDTTVRAESIRSAVAMWGVTVADIKRAKTGGCTAFRNGRIHRDELLPWLKDNPVDLTAALDEMGWKERRLKAQVDKLEMEVAKEKGKLVERHVVTEEWGKHLTFIFDTLDKSMDRHAYNAIVKEVRTYLGKYALG